MQARTQSPKPSRRSGCGVVLSVQRMLAAALLACGLVAAEARGDEARALEYGVKSAFLVKFGMFVEWPEDVFSAAPGPFTIGILGEDPFGTNFDEAVKKEKIAGRTIRILRSRQPGELKNCQMVFISASEADRMVELLAELSGRGVLTVADEPGFAGRGGMIGFVKEAGKVRFEINIGAAERAGLKVSSKLMQLSRRVGGRQTAAG